MSFSPAHASLRFGLGLAPNRPAQDEAALLAGLDGPDEMAQAYPIEPFDSIYPAELTFKEMRQAKDPGLQDYVDRIKAQEARKAQQAAATYLARCLDTPHPLRERLCAFWADHFTLQGKGRLVQNREPSFIEDAIRPHIAGKFSTLLRAAVLHPLMIRYLDQNFSVGPNSPFVAAARPDQTRRPNGLNENLAREILELHSLGVDGRYSQADIRQFAELLAGLTVRLGKGTVFEAQRAEPGAEQVLDFRSRQWTASLADVEEALDYLALHPDTARHLSWKLAVHFVSDDPDPALVQDMVERYRETDGDLRAVYELLLTHPAAQSEIQAKVKQPMEFMATSLRSMGVAGRDVMAMAQKRKTLQRYVLRDLRRMGQPWLAPGGPDGWPEYAEFWISPTQLGARLNWLLKIQSADFVPQQDPITLAYTALGPRLTHPIRFAAGAAEARHEGVAIVLASPEFQRR